MTNLKETQPASEINLKQIETALLNLSKKIHSLILAQESDENLIGLSEELSNQFSIAVLFLGLLIQAEQKGNQVTTTQQTILNEIQGFIQSNSELPQEVSQQWLNSLMTSLTEIEESIRSGVNELRNP